MSRVTCPNCKTTFDSSPKRICADCNSAIALHHKYYLKTESGKTFLVHRHCDRPFDYEYKGKTLKRQEEV